MKWRGGILALAAGIALLAPGARSTVSAADRLGLWNKDNLVAWWRNHPDPESWKPAAVELRASLLDAQKRYGIAKALANPHFVGWATHLRWLDLFPEDWQGHEFFGKEEARATFKRVSAAQVLPRLLASSLEPEDDAPKALEQLCRIAELYPKEVSEYPELAVAMAVVFDQPFPESWPHEFVEKSRVASGDLDAAQRFGFYLRAAEGDRLMIDPKGLSVKELTFLVDSILRFSEFEYAQRIELRDPAHLTGLYGAIRYDHARSTGGQFQWDYSSYELADIAERGGICADQAFFVSQAGKAQGIPTILFIGQGRSGGHAWVGYLEERGKWQLDVARVRSEKYPVGVTYDPQTWRRMTDSQLRFVMADLMKTLSYQKCQLTLQWAAMNRDEPFYREVVVLARQSMPRYFATWELEAAWLQEKDAPADFMEKFWKSWITNFRDEIDMKTKGQIALLQHYQKVEDERSAERLQEEILRDNRNDRFDLAIAVAAASVLGAAERGDWAAATAEYGDALDRFKRNAGGHLFYNLVQPYVERCLEAGKRELAAKAVDDLERIFSARPNTMLDQDIGKLRARARG